MQSATLGKGAWIIHVYRSTILSRSSKSLAMDTLSNVLSLLNVRSAFSNGLKAGGAWAIQFSTVAGIKFNAVVEGTCWLALEGDIEPVRLQAGDCFLLKGGHSFVLASDLTLPRIG